MKEHLHEIIITEESNTEVIICLKFNLFPTEVLLTTQLDAIKKGLLSLHKAVHNLTLL